MLRGGIFGSTGDGRVTLAVNQRNMAAFDHALESLLAILRNNGVDGGAIDAVKTHAAQLTQATVDDRPRLLAQVGRAVKDGLYRAGKSVKEMANLYEAYETLAKAVGVATAVIAKLWTVP